MDDNKEKAPQLEQFERSNCPTEMELSRVITKLKQTISFCNASADVVAKLNKENAASFQLLEIYKERIDQLETVIFNLLQADMTK